MTDQTQKPDEQQQLEQQQRIEQSKNAEPQVLVRVLQDCEYGCANDVAEISKSEVKDAKKFGLVDDNKEAVAYALSLKKS